MLDALTASQMAEWEAFFKLEPFGTEMDNLRTGMICSTIMNAVTAIFHDSKKGKPHRYVPSDFFPDGEEKKPQTAEEMAAKLKLMVRDGD
jgi:hypothetical protein